MLRKPSTAGILILAIAVSTPLVDARAQSVPDLSPRAVALNYFIATGGDPIVARSTPELSTTERLRSTDAAVSAADRRRHVESLRHDRFWGDVGQVLSSVFYRFFAGIVPGPNGVEMPNVAERLLDEFEVRLGDTSLSYVLQGVGNMRYLSRSYFYQQLDGVHAVRYNFVPADDASPWRMSITVSPMLSGSISLVRNHMGIYDPEDLPDQVLYGAAAGTDASFHSGPLTAGIRAYIYPQMDLGWSGSTGMSDMEAITLTFDLREAAHWDTDVPVSVSTRILHLGRGEARMPLYEASHGAHRGVGDMREVFEGLVTLDVRY